MRGTPTILAQVTLLTLNAKRPARAVSLSQHLPRYVSGSHRRGFLEPWPCILQCQSLELTSNRAICLHVRSQAYALCSCHLAAYKLQVKPEDAHLFITGTLDAGGHCVLEMPSGTGKTISLLSLIVAYQQYYPEKRKLVYCSRTMSEIEKALAELKALMRYRADQLGYEEEFRGLGLTSRKNLCLHPSVKREKSGNVVDARCRSLTAGFVKEKKERGEDVELCVYHDVRQKQPSCYCPCPFANWTVRTLICSRRITSFQMVFGHSTACSAMASSTSNALTLQRVAW